MGTTFMMQNKRNMVQLEIKGRKGVPVQTDPLEYFKLDSGNMQNVLHFLEFLGLFQSFFIFI